MILPLPLRTALLTEKLVATVIALGCAGTAASERGSRNQEAVDPGYVISYSQEVRAPRGPVGNWPDSGCFMWEFQIDRDGAPYNLSVITGSRDYGFHVSMRGALRDFRFKVAPGADANVLYRIGFHYRQGNVSANSVPSCPKP